MTDWAERAATNVLQRYAVSATVPIDVQQIAERMGISGIVERGGHGDGRLEVEGRCTRIVVRPRTAPGRRRFTIAHELGHHYLRQREIRSLAPSAEERFCNRFAAAVLMPQAWTETRGDQDETLAALFTFAADAEVSLSAGLLRLRQLCGWRGSLLRWRSDGKTWQLFAATGLPPQTPLPSSAPATSSILDRANTDGACEQWVLPLLLGSSVVDTFADLRISQRGAVAFVDLRSASRQLPSKADRIATMWQELAEMLDAPGSRPSEVSKHRLVEPPPPRRLKDSSGSR